MGLLNNIQSIATPFATRSSVIWRPCPFNCDKNASAAGFIPWLRRPTWAWAPGARGAETPRRELTTLDVSALLPASGPAAASCTVTEGPLPTVTCSSPQQREPERAWPFKFDAAEFLNGIVNSSPVPNEIDVGSLVWWA